MASAADIIFHCVRSQLIFGDGLPLGLVGSGFNFTQIRSVDWAKTPSSIHCSKLILAQLLLVLGLLGFGVI